MNTSGLLALAGLNALFAAAGVGVIAALTGIASWRDLGRRLGLAYMAGFALVLLLSTELLVVGAGIGVAQTTGMSVGILVAGLAVARLRGLPLPGRPALGRAEAAVGAGGRAGALLELAGVVPAVLVVLLALAALRVGFGQGLMEWDAWAFWVPKGAGIYHFGQLDVALFTSTAAPSYPILVPTLDALGFHFMGRVDAVTLHAQFAFLGVGWVLATVGLLRPRVPRLVVWALVGLPFLGGDFRYFVAAPLADLPLDYLFALGLVCLLLWVLERPRGMLLLTGLLFAATMATKREGLIFVAAATAAALVATLPEARRRWLPLLATMAAAWAVNLPWRFWWQSRGIADQSSPVSFSGLLDNADRVGPAIRIVLELLFDANRWSIAVPLALAALATVLLARHWRAAAFFSVVMVLGAGGLVWILWSIDSLPLDTSDQTPIPRAVGALVLGACAIAPLLVWQGLGAAGRVGEVPTPPGARRARRFATPAGASLVAAGAVALSAVGYVAASVGPDAVSAARAEPCEIDPPTNGLVAVFGRFPSLARAQVRQREAAAVGFTSTAVRRVACDTWSAAVPNIPDAEVGEEFRREAKSAGFDVVIERG